MHTIYHLCSTNGQCPLATGTHGVKALRSYTAQLHSALQRYTVYSIAPEGLDPMRARGQWALAIRAA